MKTATHARLRRTAAEAVGSIRIGCTLRLQTMWLRWYAEHNPEAHEAAVAAAREIADTAGRIERQEGFDRIDADLRARVRTWGEEGWAIAGAYDRRNEQVP